MSKELFADAFEIDKAASKIDEATSTLSTVVHNVDPVCTQMGTTRVKFTTHTEELIKEVRAVRNALGVDKDRLHRLTADLTGNWTSVTKDEWAAAMQSPISSAEKLAMDCVGLETSLAQTARTVENDLHSLTVSLRDYQEASQTRTIPAFSTAASALHQLASNVNASASRLTGMAKKL